MRVISQDGTIDVPYDYFSLSIASGKYEDVEVACIYCHNLSSPNCTKLAEYSSREKALKVMELLREVYIGMPIIMQNCDVSEDIVKEFEKLNKCGLMVQAKNEPPKIEYINNAVFRFPADDEVKV